MVANIAPEAWQEKKGRLLQERFKEIEDTYDRSYHPEPPKPPTRDVLYEPASQGIDNHPRQRLRDEANASLHRTEFLDVLEASTERQ